MKKNTLYTVLGGVWVGGTMSVPGVSGGSQAMILGLYDTLISSVNGIFDKERRKESMLFLCKFLPGAAIGIFFVARLITFLLANAVCAIPTKYFFLGAIAGGAPLIFRSAGIKRFSFSAVFYPVLGLATAWAITLIPKGLFDINGDGWLSILTGILIQLVGGIVIAVALVLPGISVSQMLLVLGIYEELAAAISTTDILAILSFLPLLIGTLGGILLTTNILEKAMKRYPVATYLLIFGFILGSLPELFPGFPSGWSMPISLCAAAVGFLLVFFASRKEAER